jgi:hypothetical protein
VAHLVNPKGESARVTRLQEGARARLRGHTTRHSHLHEFIILVSSARRLFLNVHIHSQPSLFFAAYILSCYFLCISIFTMFANGKRPPTVVRNVSLPAKKDKSRSTTPISQPSSRRHDSSRLLAKPKVRSGPLLSPSPSVKSPPRAASLKRKAPESSTPFDSDSSSDDDGSLDLRANSAKKAKQDSKEPEADFDSARQTFNLLSCSSDEQKRWPMRHGADMTGGEFAKDFRPAFGEGEECTVKLQYPSNWPPERYIAQDAWIRGS